jgi:hypothetical protein
LGFDLATNGEVSFEVTDPSLWNTLLLEELWAKWLIALILGILLFISDFCVPAHWQPYLVTRLQTSNYARVHLQLQCWMEFPFFRESAG